MAPAVALDPEVAAFLQEGLSMHAASRDAANVANLSRALGLRISPERTRVTVFLLSSHSAAMLADFRANGRIALVATKPSTHRTVQLKGDDAATVPLRKGDLEAIARTRKAFTSDLEALGYAKSLPELLLAAAREDVVAVQFTIAAAFNQTPGPAAGAPLAR